MSQQLPEEWFIKDQRINAGIAWVLTAVVVGTALLSFLSGFLVTTIVALFAAFVAVVPAATSRDWRRTVSWPLLLLASVSLALWGSGSSFFGDIIIGLSVAVLAMLVVVVLGMVTTVRMTPNFALFFVFLATAATAGFWAVGSAASAAYLGTSFVETNDELMIIFTSAAIAGLVGSLAFRWYFGRKLRADLDRGIEPEVAT